MDGWMDGSGWMDWIGISFLALSLSWVRRYCLPRLYGWVGGLLGWFLGWVDGWMDGCRIW